MTQQAMIVGLGNPGAKYAPTLHNAGFWFVDELAHRCGGRFALEKKFAAECCNVSLEDHAIRLVKPQNYMNASGGAVRAVLDYYRADRQQLLVVHDEIDLPPGTVRLKAGGGHGGHNGMRDVIRHCGAEFLRLRIGVGHPGDKSKVLNYVLKRAADEVAQAMRQNIDEAIAILPLWLRGDTNAAMKQLHTKPSAASNAKPQPASPARPQAGDA